MAKKNGNGNAHTAETTDAEVDPSFALDPSELAGMTEGFEETLTGFPPYWNPAIGKQFAGKVLYRDDRDPEFIRYAIEAACTHKCATGPADDQDTVTVKKGEIFNVSAYASLPLELYFGETVLVTAQKKRACKGGKQEVWIFSIACSPMTKSLADKRRAEQGLAMGGAQATPALAAG